MAKISHKALFDKLRDDTVISKCQLYARWTLPKLMADFTEVNTSGKVNVERDYQEVGALLANNLATKLARLLFPNLPFFRINPSQALRKAATDAAIPEKDFVAGLAQSEAEAASRVFINAGYAQLILMLQHLIVTGNVLVKRDSKHGTFHTYGLQSFAVRRDGEGNHLDIVLRQYTVVEGLPLDIQTALRISNPSKYTRPEQSVEVYTRIHRKMTDAGVSYEVTQEVDTIPVGTPSTYPEHLCPWFCPTWSIIHGEHYGRGMVEDYAGGFAKLSDVSEAQALYLIEMLRVLHLVSASSGTDIDDLMDAESGAYVRGDPESVVAHEAGDSAKSQVVTAELEAVFQRLARAFMYTAGARDAERVTAYELQRDSLEADNSLGGVYSSLASSVQVPMAHVLLAEVKTGAITGIISGDIKLEIVAGIPALGRSTDVQNLLMAIQEIAAAAAVTQIDQRFDIKRISDVILAGRSVDPSTIMFSADEQATIDEAAKQQAAGQQQLLQAANATDQISAINDITQG